MKIKPWDRQPEEPTKANKGYCIYRDLGAERTLYDAEIIYRDRYGLSTEKLKNRKPSRQFEKWSSDWDWQERNAQYDAYLEAAARKQIETERIASIKKHKKQLAEIAEQGVTNALIISKLIGVELRRRGEKIKQEGVIEPIPNKDLIGLIGAVGNTTKRLQELLQVIYPEDFKSESFMTLTVEQRIKEQFPGVPVENVVNQFTRIKERIKEQMHLEDGKTNGNSY
jgi:hypothetical protein